MAKEILVVGHLPPPVTGENLCRGHLVRRLKASGASVVDTTRSSLFAFSVSSDACVIVNGQSLLGTVFDCLLTQYHLLLGKKVFWYFHNASLLRFLQIPQWLFVRSRNSLTALVLTEFQRKLFLNRSYRCEILRNTLSDDLPNIDPSESSKKRLLWMGRGEEVKGFTIALEVHKELRKSDPTWVFDVYGVEANEAHASGISSEGVVFHGFVRGRAKIEAFEKGGIFILPSKYKNETQPLSIVESIAFGLPVVASGIGGIPEMLSNGGDRGGIIIRSGGVASYVDAVKEASFRYEFFSNGARKIYDELYSSSVYDSRLREIFGLDGMQD